MTHASLFSGIGGFDLAAQWMGWENVFQVEIDDFCQKVLAKNFPNVTRYGDIKQFDGTKYRGAIDILSGGFPCQPFSTAGSRKGTQDDRYLWPEMLRVIAEIHPSYIVGENVGGLVNWSNGLVFDEVQTSLEAQVYEVQSFILPACAVQAPHRRDRVWIIAHSLQGIPQTEPCESNQENRLHRERTSDFTCRHLSVKWDDLKRDSGVSRNGNGVSNWVDRISGLGNAIVPQVAFEIFKAIEVVNQTNQ